MMMNVVGHYQRHHVCAALRAILLDLLELLTMVMAAYDMV